jgi:hypothetical protein
MFENRYAQNLFELLSFLAGKHVARDFILSMCKNMGVRAEDLTKDHMPFMAGEIRKRLAAFIGKEASDSIADKINHIQY